MKVPRSHTIDQLGIAEVGRRISLLGWLFRPQPIGDVGIDAQIEIVTEGVATGRLIAAQIKSGSSYFQEHKNNGFVFRGDLKHLNYWLGHSLPVIVVIFNPHTGDCLWASVSRDTVVETPSGWHMIIPADQPLGEKSLSKLAMVVEGSPYGLRLRQLQMAVPWMEELAKGTSLVLEVAEWVNKSSGRGDFKLIVDAGSGRGKVIADWPFVFLPGVLYEEAIPALLPWADMAIDQEVYDESEHDQWELECGAWDNEEGRYVMYSEDFDEWRENQGLNGLRPYSSDGEVARWRIRLSISEIGRAFLLLNTHLEGRQL